MTTAQGASRKRMPKDNELNFIEDARRIREGHITDVSQLTCTGMLHDSAEALLRAFKEDGEPGFWESYDSLKIDNTLLEEWEAAIRTASTPGEKQEDPQAANSKKTLINLADLRNRPRPKWVIEGWIYENTITELYAEAGCFKSFLAFDWSARIATGTDWLGQVKTHQQGVVIYIAAEGADGYISRSDAWCKHNDISFDTLAKNFFFWPESLPLTNSAEVGAFIEEVATTLQELDQKPRLVVIDTLLRCSNGENINSPDVMGSIFMGASRIKDELNIPNVLIVHHAGKNAQLGGMGSVVMKNNCDCVYYMSKDRDVEGQVILKAEKMKDKPELEIYLKSEKVYYTDLLSEDDSSLVLVDGAKAIKDDGKKKPDSQQAMLDILDAHKELAYEEWFRLWHDPNIKGRSKSNFDKIRRGFIAGKIIEEHNSKYKRYAQPDAEQSTFTHGKVA